MRKIVHTLLLIIILCLLISCSWNIAQNSVTKKDTSKRTTELFQQEEFTLWYETINDSVEAPTVLFIPKDYNPEIPTPLVVSLHGLVGVDYFRPEPLEDAKNNWCLEEARKRNWLLLIPYSNNDCMWWDESGMENLRRQILSIKSKYNIADNQIYVTGFSDGASGSFHLAMKMPDIFAGFYPLNGMLNVGSFVSNTPIAIKNLQNRFTYVINTDKDRLYPASETRKLIELAIENNANIFYKEYFGIGHDFAYAEKEIPHIFQSMANTRRNPFQSVIYWETDNTKYGKCDWIEILELDTLRSAANWHNKPNTLIDDKRMSFGFYDDKDYPEVGVRVDSVLPKSSVANAGVEAGDIILSMDNTRVKDINDLINLRNNKKRGDSYQLTIARGREQIELKANFLPPQSYNALLYNKPTGAIKATYLGNVFYIETSKVKAIKIYIHPNMVNLDNPVTVIVNGEKLFEENLKIDKTFYNENLENTYDAIADWTTYLELDIKK